MRALLRRLVRREDGVTFIEMLVVIVVIAIMVDAAMATLLSQTEKAHESAAAQRFRLAETNSAAQRVFSRDYPSDFATRLQEDEPSLGVQPTTAFTQTPTFPVGELEVERTSPSMMKFRTGSPVGMYYGLTLDEENDKVVKIRTKGDDLTTHTNNALNPSLEYEISEGDVGGWNTSQCNGTRSTEKARFGHYSLRCVNSSATRPEAGPYDPAVAATNPLEGAPTPGLSGVVVSARGSVYPEEGTIDRIVQLCLRPYSQTDVELHNGLCTTTSAPAGEWTDVATTKTMPAGTHKVGVFMRGHNTNGAMAPNDVTYFDAFAINVSDTEAPPYFDGDFPQAAWQGVGGGDPVPGESPSFGFAWEEF